MYNIQKGNLYMVKGSTRADGFKSRKGITTHTGHQLTQREEKFIQFYLEGKSLSEAVTLAGYKNKNPKHYAFELLNKPHIDEEINYRVNLIRTKTIADSTEILTYWTQVMRGEVNDQFGLDASLSERNKAASELAKRIIDPERKSQSIDNNITVKLVKE